MAAGVAAPIIALAPVVAVECLLLTAILVITGASSYWPTNLFTVGAGAVAGIGCINGVMLWLQARSGRRPEDPPRRKRRKPKSRGKRVDDDESGSLVALTAGAIAAAIIGALP